VTARHGVRPLLNDRSRGIEETLDAELLARIQFETVSVAYKRFFPAGSRPPTTRQMAGIWQERLSDPSARAFVATDHGRVVGAVAVRANAEFDAEGELTGLHVLPEAWGRGFGSALHDRALGEMVEHEFKSAGLWVIEANTRARQMYESRQWVLRPEIKLHQLGITEVRYRRFLSDVDGA
jgi:ribosomal protein S18 acetylase RimI-like enzyme